MVGTQDSLTRRIVESVAAATDTDPLDLPPLYDTVDPDALADVIEGADQEKVAVEYAGVNVIVHGDGAVETTPAPGSRQE